MNISVPEECRNHSARQRCGSRTAARLQRTHLGFTDQNQQTKVKFFTKHLNISQKQIVETLDLKLTKLRKPAYDMIDQKSSSSSKCVSLGEVMSQYDLSNCSQLSMEHLKNICLAFMHQELLPVFPTEGPTHKALDPHVWGYGFLAVSIINLFSLLGLAVIPCIAKSCFPKVLTYFIGLGIGTLFSSAVLQLIPEALESDTKADNYNLIVTGIFGGFYFLFFTERILKMVLKSEHEHNQTHERPPVESHNGNVSNSREGIPGSSMGSINTISSAVPFDLTVEQETHVSTVCCAGPNGWPLSAVRTVAWMVTLTDMLHNFVDGLVIGTSFAMSVFSGFNISIAIVCEEFPHELGDFVILLNAGLSVPQAIFFNLLSSLSCYLGLVLGILMGSTLAPNVFFAIAGGMFLYIALVDMFPEMNNILQDQERTNRNNVLFFLIQNAGLLSGFAIILLITLFAGDVSLEQ